MIVDLWLSVFARQWEWFVGVLLDLGYPEVMAIGYDIYNAFVSVAIASAPVTAILPWDIIVFYLVQILVSLIIGATIVKILVEILGWIRGRGFS